MIKYIFIFTQKGIIIINLIFVNFLKLKPINNEALIKHTRSTFFIKFEKIKKQKLLIILKYKPNIYSWTFAIYNGQKSIHKSAKIDK